MRITFNENEVMFSFPRFQKRKNDPNGPSNYPTFTGIIYRHRGFDEMGFGRTIDMAHRNRPHEVSDILVAWDGNEQNFREKCRELNIGIDEIKGIAI